MTNGECNLSLLDRGLGVIGASAPAPTPPPPDPPPSSDVFDSTFDSTFN